VKVLDATDHTALRDLSYRYAEGVDRRDTALYLSAFTAEARLHVYNADGATTPLTDLRGHEELADVTAQITRFSRTFHLVGNARYDGDGDRDAARGEVYCVAHHLQPAADGATDLVLHIRYADRYLRADGVWAIADRRVIVEWTEVHEVGPAFGAVPVRGGT